MLVDGSRHGRGDRGLAPERFPLVAEDESVPVDPGVIGAELLEGVLHFEEIGEVAGGLDADGESRRVGAVAEDRQLLVEAVTDGALADDRELRIDVHRSRGGNEEEPHFEVLQVVSGEGGEPHVVHRQDPRREEPRVVGEQTRGIGRRCLDVTALIADDERVAIEDPDHGLGHR